MTWDSETAILTEEDLMMAENQTRPALRSAIDDEPKWESFNEWRCFDKDEIELRASAHCKVENPNDCTEVPSLSVLHDEEIYEFDADSVEFGATHTTLAEWKRLTKGQSKVCIYAAKLQEEDVANATYRKLSSWVVERVKTRLGTWSGSDG